MTPKEKAKELVDKFNYELIGQAKQYALFIVCEVIKQNNSLFEKGLKNVHQSLSTPVKMYSDVLNKELDYWQKVKQEIEIL